MLRARGRHAIRNARYQIAETLLRPLDLQYAAALPCFGHMNERGRVRGGIRLDHVIHPKLSVPRTSRLPRVALSSSLVLTANQ